ncbi:MAG: DUF167 domain-containing protein [Patescibacteria group bacterium]
MRIFVTTKPKAKEDLVEQIDPTHFKVSVKAPPVDGKANDAVERVVAEFLEVSPSQVRVVFGHTSKKKVIEVL